MARHSALATKRLDLISRGIDPGPLSQDPALRIPSLKFDSWENLTTGFGNSSQHAVANSQYTALDKIDDYQLEQMYRSDWVTRKCIDAPAEDMTRNGISYQHNDDDENKQKQTEDFNDYLVETCNLWNVAFQAVALSGIAGGSLTLFNYDDIQTEFDLRNPLNENQVKEIRWIRVIPSWFAIPLSYYRDINHPKWGQPEHYQVVIREAGFGVTLTVHESRMIRYDGRFTTQTAKVQNRGWNDSSIQAIYTALRDYGVCVTESTSTLESFTQDYLGMKGLAEKVMNNETDVVLERIFLSHLKMNSSKVALFDSESESMERKGTPITGLADLWDRYSEAICGASNIPRSRFFSSESGALGGNAAESDTRNYFNRIKSFQERDLRPYLNAFFRMVNYALRSLDELPSYSFKELREQSDKEKAETRYAVAQRDQIYLQEGVISAEEVANSRFSKDEMDLDTMNLDFEAREEMEKEIENEEIENLRAELENIKDEHAQIMTKPVGKEPEEKKDSAPTVIEHKPEINVESPQITVNIPEQKDNTDLIKSLRGKLDKIESKLNEEIEINIEGNKKAFRLNSTFIEAEHPRDESGKFTDKGSEGERYPQDYEEMIDTIEKEIEKLKEDYEFVGIRRSDEPDENEDTRSVEWEDGERSDRKLPGISTIDVDYDNKRWGDWKALSKDYHYKYIYVVAGEDADGGNDIGEIVIKPKVVKLIGEYKENSPK